MYERIHKAEGASTVQLPTRYPVGALVGCVKVVGLQAAQVEAWHGLPNTVKEEVGSRYCFLCQVTFKASRRSEAASACPLHIRTGCLHTDLPSKRMY